MNKAKFKIGDKVLVKSAYLNGIPIDKNGILEIINIGYLIYSCKVILGYNGDSKYQNDKNWSLKFIDDNECELFIDYKNEIKETIVPDKQEVKNNPIDALAKGIQDSLGGLVTTVLQESRDKIQKDLLDFKKEIKNEFRELTENIPVMEIKIGDLQKVKKLSVRANPLLPRLILNSKLRLYTLLVGPAGCGKTTLAHQLAEALGVQFGAVCLTAGASETWLFGRQTANGFVEGPFAKLYKEGGVFLADEMDAADANLLLSMNTALSHDEFINPMNGELMKKHKDFVFIGAANTNGKGANHVYTGRTRLDAATLDRFIILDMDYDVNLEKSLCNDEHLRNFLNELRSKLKNKKLDEFISTRAYKNMYSMHNAGVPYKDLVDSLISNWSDVSRKIALDVYNSGLSKVKEELPEDSLYKILGKGSNKKERRNKSREIKINGVPVKEVEQIEMEIKNELPKVAVEEIPF